MTDGSSAPSEFDWTYMVAKSDPLPPVHRVAQSPIRFCGMSEMIDTTRDCTMPNDSCW